MASTICRPGRSLRHTTISVLFTMVQPTCKANLFVLSNGLSIITHEFRADPLCEIPRLNSPGKETLVWEPFGVITLLI